MVDVLVILGKIILYLTGIMVVFLIGVAIYIYMFKDWIDYRKARSEIIPFVKSYKTRCSGSNRFLVSVESLQDSFQEYDTKIIEKVWLELIDKRVIEMDPLDNVWCIRSINSL